MRFGAKAWSFLKVGQSGLLVAALAMASGCRPTGGPPAPAAAGVCWRADIPARHRPIFVPVAAQSPDILSCAADLELAYLSEGAPVIGAYQGWYLFIGPGAIEGAERLNLIRYPLLNKAQRASLDRQLRALLVARSQSGAP